MNKLGHIQQVVFLSVENTKILNTSLPDIINTVATSGVDEWILKAQRWQYCTEVRNLVKTFHY